jgi:hypothetical protein
MGLGSVSSGLYQKDRVLNSNILTLKAENLLGPHITLEKMELSE